MRHGSLAAPGAVVAAVAILLVALLAGPAPAAEVIATVTVEAGEHDRVDTPIRVALPAAADWPAVMLRESRDGKARNLPCQVDPGSPPHLAFILWGRMEAGSTRTFEVVPRPAGITSFAAAGPTVIRKSEGCVEVEAWCHLVLRYNTTQTKAGAAGDAGPAGAPGPAKALKICMISGAREYEANESCAFFKALLEKNYAVTCTHVRSKDKAESLPGIEALKDSDLLFVFCRRTEPREAHLKAIQQWCAAGKPVVGVRTASHAFQNWLAFDKEVLGGNYKGHYGRGPAAEVHFVEEAKDHPILAGVEPFASPYSLYKNTGLAGDATLLATATAGGKTEPVAWTRLHNGGRVFYTSLGGPEDFRNPNFQRMLTNAVFWTAGRQRPEN